MAATDPLLPDGRVDLADLPITDLISLHRLLTAFADGSCSDPARFFVVRWLSWLEAEMLSRPDHSALELLQVMQCLFPLEIMHEPELVAPIYARAAELYAVHDLDFALPKTGEHKKTEQEQRYDR